LEKSRGTLQTQFDQWYANLHARDGQLSNPSRSTYNTQQPVQQMAHSSSSNDSKRYDDRDRLREADKKSPRGVYSADAKLGASNGGRTPRGGPDYEEKQKRGSAIVNPKTVDDSDEDDEVNEDIEAFYKAKNELLKRRGNN
jgi:hypothetical protein